MVRVESSIQKNQQSYILTTTNHFMVTKFKIGEEYLDIPRGINLPTVGDAISIKMDNQVKSYIVDNVMHVLDYDVAIKTGRTVISLKEI